MMRFVFLADGLLGVGQVKVIVTLISHGVKLRNDESDADENVENCEKGEVDDGARGSLRARAVSVGRGGWTEKGKGGTVTH